MNITKIVSGGQTGVDRGALDAARAKRVQIGGWVPKGRLAEDGRISDEYELSETATSSYDERTRLNVRDSDGTLIISRGPLAGGSHVTRAVAVELGRPHLHLDVTKQSLADCIHTVAEWAARHRISTLNVAGPRQSEDAGAYRSAYEIVTGLFTYAR